MGLLKLKHGCPLLGILASAGLRVWGVGFDGPVLNSSAPGNQMQVEVTVPLK